MQYRKATVSDIEQMHSLRVSVKENALSHPSVIKNEDYVEYLKVRGEGWVCVINNGVVGFAIVDIIDRNIWAMFVMPAYERLGVGRKLHEMILNWYFSQTKENVWLSTAANSRAERFYKKAGWQEVGVTKSGEVKFEMSHQQWLRLKEKNAEQ